MSDTKLHIQEAQRIPSPPLPKKKKKKKKVPAHIVLKKKNLKDTLPTDEKRYELYLTSPQKPSKQDSQMKVSREKKKKVMHRGVV